MKLLNIVVFCIFVLIASIAKSTNNLKQEKSMAYHQQEVTFTSGENNLKGILFTPTQSNGKAVTLVGPVGYVKEQAPLLYGQSLAARGYIALIYDPTSHGESEGQPRRFESARQKTRDIIASVDYLTSLDQVDASEIYSVAICQGVNWMIKATNQDDRIKAMSLVAGHYLDPEVAKLYNGGEVHLAEVLEKAQQAKDKFEATGQVEYVPIVGSAEEGALLTAPPVYDWYIPWENNHNNLGGQWENRITRMSLVDIWGEDIQMDLINMEKPTLLIHSDHAASGPDVPKRLFEAIPTQNKELVWFEDQFQTLFYDNKTLIDRAVGHVDQWFQRQSNAK